MHLVDSRLNRISEVLMHGRFFEKFMKSWEISLATCKNMEKVQAVPTMVVFSFYQNWDFSLTVLELCKNYDKFYRANQNFDMTIF